MLYKLIRKFLSDALLLGYSVFVLFLFVLMWLSFDGCIFIGEPNVVIRTIETIFCIACVAYAIYRIHQGLLRAIIKAIKDRRRNGLTKA